MKFLPLILLVFIFSFCSEGKNSEDSYKDTLLLQYLVTPNAPQETCESMITNKDLCFQAYYTSVGGSFTATSATVKTQTCQGLITSPLYKNMSSIAQTCSFNCQSNDWKTKTNVGTCGQLTFAGLIEASITSPTAIACLRSCFATTNNQISNDQIPLYFLFNIIQDGD
ncbi:MAG: hypothetical protein ACO1NV_12480 [Leptospira bouyouniensis]|uniref:Uncharacterized protein n=1 Tax=Leptospira bouyouniensis TaxID=2484911 RepID=A0A7I0ITH3_9LEPT|nr:hypothetical protein [Leptospira bouyouniensis]TGK52936.1 hypothetical protein EHQ10_04105 [Leptospira bouyouniensis]TGL08429.1 hypothetical protein EHQ43_05135 [Leptospira bouyouniensis]TGM87152.1 hypothetical protein EHQ99_01265 [Leptospira bouyouniensis]